MCVLEGMERYTHGDQINSFHHLGLGDELKSSDLVASAFNALSHFVGPRFFFF